MSSKVRLVAVLIGVILVVSLAGPLAHAAKTGCTVIGTGILPPARCSWKATKTTPIRLIGAGGWTLYVDGIPRCHFYNKAVEISSKCYVEKGQLVSINAYWGVVTARQVKT